MPSTELLANQEPPVALFAHIAARFDQLDLPHWTAVVFTWLSRYDGLGRCYFADEEDTPALEVLRCISSLERGVNDESVADALSHLEFLCWRVRHHETEERWNPLITSLYEFIGTETPPDCWKWDDAYPSSAGIATWLLDQLPER